MFAARPGIIWQRSTLPSGADFVVDTFTSASNETIPGHVGEVGATWTVPYGETGNPTISGGVMAFSGGDKYRSSGASPASEAYIELGFKRSNNAGVTFFISFSNYVADNLFSNSLRDGPTCLVVATADTNRRLEVVSNPSLSTDVVPYSVFDFTPQPGMTWTENVIRFEVKSTGCNVILNGVTIFTTSKTFDVTGRYVTIRGQSSTSTYYMDVTYIKAGTF